LIKEVCEFTKRKAKNDRNRIISGKNNQKLFWELTERRKWLLTTVTPGTLKVEIPRIYSLVSMMQYHPENKQWPLKMA
jgi:hypothetical protein